MTTAGTYTIAVTGPIAATSPPFKIDTGTNVYGGAEANGLSFYQVQRDGAELHPVGAAHGARAPERPERDDLLDPELQRGLGTVLGRPLTARHADRRVRRLVGRGRLPQVRPDDELHGCAAARGRARLPRADGERVRRTSRPRRSSARTGCCGCGTTRRRRSTTRSGSAPGTRRRSATTTSGGSRRPTTPIRGRTRVYRYIRNRPVFRAGPPGSLISPNLAGRDAAAFAECFVVFKTTDPAFANRCLTGGRAHLRPREHGADGQPADGDPVQLLSRDRVARRPGARRDRAVLRGRRRAACRPACPTPTRRSTCRRRPTGRTPTSPGRTTRPTR